MSMETNPFSRLFVSMICRKALQAHVLEKSNRDRINVYRVNGCWVAFDVSAYFVSRLVRGCDVSVLEFPDAVVASAEMDDACLDELKGKCRLLECGAGRMSFAAGLSRCGYRRWRAEQAAL